MDSERRSENTGRTTALPIPDRRGFLRGVGAAGIVGVAGCLGGDDGDDGENGTENGDDGENGDDDTENGDGDGPFFEVSDLSPTDATASVGDPMDVSATITNTGDGEGTQSVEARMDGEAVDSTELTLAAEEEDSVSFSLDTSDMAAGEHEYGVYSEDDSATGTMTMHGEDLMGEDPAVLVFSATDGFRHGNIETGNARLEEMGQEMIERHAAERETAADDVQIDVIDDPEGNADEFPADVSELEQYDVVVWNNTTGSVLDDDQQAAFQEYVENGGGYAGIHSASDTHYDWDWYGDLVGAYFDGHPAVQEAEVNVTDRAHPSTEFLPTVWERTDEWYDFDESPRGDVHVLATLDEDTYDNAGMDNGRADHPIAWCQEFEDGRSWYTEMGHTEESWSEDDYVRHVLNGIMWAAGWLEGDATGTVWDSYEKEVLEDGVAEPMVMDVTPDNRLFYIQRTGRVGVIDLESGETATALELDVYTQTEDGGLGLAFDPDFDENNWVYLYYSPAEDEYGDEGPFDRLSRFEVDGDSIDSDSESEMLRVHKQNNTDGHAGGDLDFDADGNLYVTVGDDTTPFESDAFTPIDETYDEWGWDAQNASADTSNYRGKILRITPTDDGGYEIPEGNFREYWEDETGESFDEEVLRPEIYVWGCRNPFRASIDHETNVLYYADYGPDSGAWDPARGPMGMVEYSRVEGPRFDGWPYVHGPNIPYVDYDFETSESGEMFDPENLINDAPLNEGIEDLPTPEPATMFTPYSWETYLNPPDNYEEYVPHDENPFPSLPGGGAPMSGVNYRVRSEYDGDALPASFDGKWFIMEWGGGWIKYVTMDDDGNVREIDDFLPDEEWVTPMDMTVGPDGTLYVIEYDVETMWGDGPGRISAIRRS